MRNIFATVVQAAALGCILVGLFTLSAVLAAGCALALAGWFLAPERKK